MEPNPGFTIEWSSGMDFSSLPDDLLSLAIADAREQRRVMSLVDYFSAEEYGEQVQLVQALMDEWAGRTDRF